MSTSRTLKDIVIVGAGPIGLYTAIQLKKRGVKNVTVIDPRMGKFTRPGILDASVFESLEKQLGTPVPYSSSRHIKDAERSLYKIALTMGVNLQALEFKALDDAGLQVQEKNSTNGIKKLPCDFVLDGTGSQRSLINALEIKTEAAADNPIKNHFIAYVTMTAEDSALLSSGMGSTPLYNTLALEKLRREFGWTEYAPPTFNYQILHKNKVCMYCETPPSLDPQKKEAWLKAVLELKTGKKEIEFKKIPDKEPTSDEPHPLKKPRLQSFIVDPKKVTVPIFYSEKNHLTIAPIGDAQIDPDYRIGFGVKSGIERVNAFLNALTINSHGEIANINTKQYESELALLMRKHESELQALYSDRRSQFFRALTEQKKQYEQAFKESTSEEEKKIISEGRIHIAFKIAQNLRHEALEKLNEAVDKNTGEIKLDEYKNIKNEIALLSSKAKLEEALKILPTSFTEEKKSTENALLSIAKKYKDVGNIFFKSERFADARDNFQLALDIYKNFSTTHLETLQVYSNLILSFLKLTKFDAVITTANVVLSTTEAKKDLDDLITKITYNKTDALLEKILLEEKAETANVLFLEAKKLLTTLEGKVPTRIYNKLVTKLSPCQTKLNTLEERAEKLRAASTVTPKKTI